MRRVSDLELAREVISGKYGNGITRKRLLGNRYPAVQSLVTEMMRGKPEKEPDNGDDIFRLVRIKNKVDATIIVMSPDNEVASNLYDLKSLVDLSILEKLEKERGEI